MYSLKGLNPWPWRWGHYQSKDTVLRHFLTYPEVFGDVHIAGPDVTESTLLDHLAALVGVGDACGHASAAGPRAGAPGGRLSQTVLVPAVVLIGGRWKQTGGICQLQTSCSRTWQSHFFGGPIRLTGQEEVIFSRVSCFPLQNRDYKIATQLQYKAYFIWQITFLWFSSTCRHNSTYLLDTFKGV